MTKEIRSRILRRETENVGTEWRRLEKNLTGIIDELRELNGPNCSDHLERVSEHLYRFLSQLDSTLEREERGE